MRSTLESLNPFQSCHPCCPSFPNSAVNNSTGSSIVLIFQPFLHLFFLLSFFIFCRSDRAMSDIWMRFIYTPVKWFRYSLTMIQEGRRYLFWALFISWLDWFVLVCFLSQPLHLSWVLCLVNAKNKLHNMKKKARPTHREAQRDLTQSNIINLLYIHFLCWYSLWSKNFQLFSCSVVCIILMKTVLKAWTDNWVSAKEVVVFCMMMCWHVFHWHFTSELLLYRSLVVSLLRGK